MANHGGIGRAAAHSLLLFFPLVPALSQITVTTTADTNKPVGTLTLREAIQLANTTPGPQLISFAVPQTDPGYLNGVFTIRPATRLPLLTDNGTTIDGSTQTAFTGDTNPAGPEVVLDGSALAGEAHGLQVQSAGNVIHGLIIGNFRGVEYASAVYISGDAAIGNRVTGCFLGVDHTGASPMPNGRGVTVSASASSTTIGGTAPELRNVISGNWHRGVQLEFGAAANTRVLGNFIGTDSSGRYALGNRQGGVGFDRSSGNLIGGLEAGCDHAAFSAPPATLSRATRTMESPSVPATITSLPATSSVWTSPEPVCSRTLITAWASVWGRPRSNPSGT